MFNLNIIRGALFFVTFLFLILAAVFAGIDRVAEMWIAFVVAAVVATVRFLIGLRGPAVAPTSEYPRPQGVRILHRDGTATECELGWRGLDDDGDPVWVISTEFNPRAGDKLHVDLLPARTALVMPTSLRPGDEKNLAIRAGYSERWWQRWPLAVASLLLIVWVGMLAAPAADADEVTDYANIYGYAVCGTLDEYPSFGGIEGTGEAIHDDGFTYEEAGQIIAIAVDDICPRHLTLLQRFIDAYAPGQMI